MSSFDIYREIGRRRAALSGINRAIGVYSGGHDYRPFDRAVQERNRENEREDKRYGIALAAREAAEQRDREDREAAEQRQRAFAADREAQHRGWALEDGARNFAQQKELIDYRDAAKAAEAAAQSVSVTDAMREREREVREEAFLRQQEGRDGTSSLALHEAIQRDPSKRWVEREKRERDAEADAAKAAAPPKASDEVRERKARLEQIELDAAASRLPWPLKPPALTPESQARRAAAGRAEASADRAGTRFAERITPEERAKREDAAAAERARTNEEQLRGRAQANVARRIREDKGLKFKFLQMQIQDPEAYAAELDRLVAEEIEKERWALAGPPAGGKPGPGGPGDEANFFPPAAQPLPESALPPQAAPPALPEPALPPAPSAQPGPVLPGDLPTDQPFAAIDQSPAFPPPPSRAAGAFIRDEESGRTVTPENVRDATSVTIDRLKAKHPAARQKALEDIQRDPERFRAMGVDVQAVIDIASDPGADDVYMGAWAERLSALTGGDISNATESQKAEAERYANAAAARRK